MSMASKPSRYWYQRRRTDRHVLYFRGGGYAFGTEPLLRDFTWRLGAATGATVLYFDYRLAPEHPFPAAVEDAAKVFRSFIFSSSKHLVSEEPSSGTRSLCGPRVRSIFFTARSRGQLQWRSC